MITFLHKKILPIFISIVFFVVVTGAFAGKAEASLADDIAKNLNLPFESSRISGVRDLPAGLSAAQIVDVRTKIETAQSVLGILSGSTGTSLYTADAPSSMAATAMGLRQAFLNVETAQNDYNLTIYSHQIVGGVCEDPTSSTCTTNSAVVTAQTALDTAEEIFDITIINLQDALVAERNNQDSLLDIMLQNNSVASLAQSTISILATTTEQASTGMQSTSQIDAQQGTVGSVSSDDVAAAAERDRAAAELLGTSGAGVAISSGSTGGSTTPSATFIGKIDGTTLTVENVSSGSITVGQAITGTGVMTGTKIVSTIAASGYEGTYKVNNSQTVASVTMSAPGVASSGGGSGSTYYDSNKDEIAVRMHSACKIISTSPRIMPCIAEGVYYVLYKPVSFALAGSGMIFDFVLMLSVDNSKDMVVPSFIGDAWTVVRDFSNMLFIFVLLYTGIMTMFGAADWRKVVLQVVVIALLINFSLFFTKVIIDAGNVLAMGVKSAITTDTNSISAGLVGSFAPQKFLQIAASSDINNTESTNAIIVFLIATLVSGFAAYILFKAALLFFGRLLGFWFLMIVSPFAFISTTLPKGNIFHKWFEELLGLSFVAPVFLFFIYLIMTVLQSGDNGILGSFNQTETGWFNSLLGPVLVATLLIVALQKALAAAEDMSGSFGKTASGMISAAVSGASVVATGGAMAAAGVGAGLRATRGRMAANELESGVDRNGVALTDARRATLEARTKSSYDIRNFGDKDSLIGKTMSGKIFKKDYGVGGVEKVEKGRIDKELKAVEAGKIGIFEEQGVRARVAQEIESSKKELAAAESIATSADKLAEQMRVSAEVAQKEHNESPTAKEVKRTRVAYTESLNGPVNMQGRASAKAAFEKAESDHASSPTAMAVGASMAAVEKANKEAQSAHETVSKIQSKISPKDEKGREINLEDKAVGDRNASIKTASINKITSEGRHVTAAKIRTGTSKKDQLAKIIKEMDAENSGGGEKPEAAAKS